VKSGDFLENYKIVFSYDGTSYHGFQVQENALTVQEVLERGLEKIYGKKIRVEVAGRTDAGVHARGQVANFFAPGNISSEVLPLALNSVLPRDIVVIEASRVDQKFHARRDACAKTYSYTINNGRFPDVFLRLYSWHIADRLCVEDMKLAASFLLGKHDFKAFQASGSSVETTEREIFFLEIEQRGYLITLWFKGDGFLYKMVRNITGTLIEIGLKKRKPEDMQSILRSGNRQNAGKTAPAKGLCLEKVFYHHTDTLL
jgi:tRNA pseudouridine38-40 synthase